MIRQTVSQNATNRKLPLVVLYQNDWCQIVNVGTVYILKSKSGKYNDQYFQTFANAKIAIGLTP
jgi:hypothetical protein